MAEEVVEGELLLCIINCVVTFGVAALELPVWMLDLKHLSHSAVANYPIDLDNLTGSGEACGSVNLIENDERSDRSVNPSSAEASERSDDTPGAYKRRLLDTMKEGKKKKMAKALPAETQMLSCMKEELAMNKKLFDQMATMDEAIKGNMESFSNNVQSLNQTLMGGFVMLRDMLQPTTQAAMPFDPQYPNRYVFPPMQNN